MINTYLAVLLILIDLAVISVLLGMIYTQLKKCSHSLGMIQFHQAAIDTNIMLIKMKESTR